MKYDFTSMIDRKGKDATAVEAAGRKVWGFEPGAPMKGFSFIPMWVADMNFATCPAITDAIIERAKHPLFGYFMPKDEYYEAIINWQEKRHHVTGLTREDIGYENGVHGLIASAIDVLTEPGESIFLHRPYYVGFIGDIIGKGRRPVYSDLKKDAEGVWRMDYGEMDRVIRENHVHLAIFCSPHNPCGRVWTREELEEAMAIFERNDCLVISDEIWSDLVYSGHEHIPAQMVSDWTRMHVLGAYAPSKTFNLAGLIGSYHIIYNPVLRDKIVHFSGNTHYNEMNVFSEHALMGAYSKEGAEWTDELLTVLEENCRYAVHYIRENFPGVETAMPEGTYMLFLDCTKFCESTGRSIDQVLRAGWNVGVGWQTGKAFGGRHHIRLNLALPKTLLDEAFERMKKYVFTSEDTIAYSAISQENDSAADPSQDSEGASGSEIADYESTADNKRSGNAEKSIDEIPTRSGNAEKSIDEIPTRSGNAEKSIDEIPTRSGKNEKSIDEIRALIGRTAKEVLAANHSGSDSSYSGPDSSDPGSDAGASDSGHAPNNSADTGSAPSNSVLQEENARPAASSEDFTTRWTYNDDGLMAVSDEENLKATVQAVKELLAKYPLEDCHLARFVNGEIVGNDDMSTARNYCQIIQNGGYRTADLFDEEEQEKLRQIGIL